MHEHVWFLLACHLWLTCLVVPNRTWNAVQWLEGCSQSLVVCGMSRQTWSPGYTSEDSTPASLSAWIAGATLAERYEEPEPLDSACLSGSCPSAWFGSRCHVLSNPSLCRAELFSVPANIWRLWMAVVSSNSLVGACVKDPLAWRCRKQCDVVPTDTSHGRKSYWGCVRLVLVVGDAWQFEWPFMSILWIIWCTTLRTLSKKNYLLTMYQHRKKGSGRIRSLHLAQLPCLLKDLAQDLYAEHDQESWNRNLTRKPKLSRKRCNSSCGTSRLPARCDLRPLAKSRSESGAQKDPIYGLWNAVYEQLLSSPAADAPHCRTSRRQRWQGRSQQRYSRRYTHFATGASSTQPALAFWLHFSTRRSDTLFWQISMQKDTVWLNECHKKRLLNCVGMMRQSFMIGGRSKHMFYTSILTNYLAVQCLHLATSRDHVTANLNSLLVSIPQRVAYRVSLVGHDSSILETFEFTRRGLILEEASLHQDS